MKRQRGDSVEPHTPPPSARKRSSMHTLAASLGIPACFLRLGLTIYSSLECALAFTRLHEAAKYLHRVPQTLQ